MVCPLDYLRVAGFLEMEGVACEKKMQCNSRQVKV